MPRELNQTIRHTHLHELLVSRTCCVCWIGVLPVLEHPFEDFLMEICKVVMGVFDEKFHYAVGEILRKKHEV